MFLLICFLSVLILFKFYNVVTVGKCTSRCSMSGKVVIVTGANSGIGYETAKDLAARGAKVILACRNAIRGRRAEESIINETGNKNVFYKQLNLTSFSSVRAFVDVINKSEERLDVLINNAGIMLKRNQYTDDGIIEDMQINYFSHFLLTILLLPLLKKSTPSRIVNISSFFHFLGVIDFKKINLKSHYNFMRKYCNAKLCTVLFTEELSRKLKGSGVVANSVHPGFVYTTLVKHLGFILSRIISLLYYIFFKTQSQGAQTTIHVAVSKECEVVSGKYFYDCHEGWTSRKVNDSELSAKLWEYSVELVKLKASEII